MATQTRFMTIKHFTPNTTRVWQFFSVRWKMKLQLMVLPEEVSTKIASNRHFSLSIYLSLSTQKDFVQVYFTQNVYF